MNIGILGSDDRAAAIGRLLASGGHDVTYSDPSNPQRCAALAASLRAEVEIPYRQGMTRDLLFITTSAKLEKSLTALGSGFHASIVDARVDGAKSGTSAQILAHKLDTHDLVRALLVLPQSGANVPICGDDEQAKILVDEALRACGCVTTDRGPLQHADELEQPQTVAA